MLARYPDSALAAQCTLHERFGMSPLQPLTLNAPPRAARGL